MNSFKWEPIFPGWALSTVSWKDRTKREGWETRYTSVGARPRSASPTPNKRLINGLSSVLVAQRPYNFELDANTAYWVTLARRYLQRGSLPPAGKEVHSISTTTDLLFGLFTPGENLVDRNLNLDRTYEVPFFDLIRSEWPKESQFLFPQAPFESIADLDTRMTERWVDFMFVPPDGISCVLEIDGDHHKRRAWADETRDSGLMDSGIEVHRSDGVDCMDTEGNLLRVFNESSTSQASDTDLKAWREVLLAVRSAYGIIEGVVCGILEPGAKWSIALPSGFGDRDTFFELLNALAALDRLWKTDVIPQEITFNGADKWDNPWPVKGSSSSGGSDATILVDWGPTWGALPEGAGSPDVIIRAVPLPIHPEWDAPLSSERRNLDYDFLDEIDDFFEELLISIAGPVFGFNEFRHGQSRAIKQILTGRDCCVLLPTGYGKTLVFQVSGLLRQGLTVTVAPINALINDLERRFLDAGIDRVAAIHSGRTSEQGLSEILHSSIAKQNALFTFIAPERLQIKAFRDSLESTVENSLVSLLVVDEMHCVSEWGHDFRVSYLRLGRNLRHLCRGVDDVSPPLLAMTATASPGVLRDVLRELEIDDSAPEVLQRSTDFDRPNLKYEVLVGTEDEIFPTLRKAFIDSVPNALHLELQELSESRGSETASGVLFVPWSKSDYGVSETRKKLRDWFREAEIAVPNIEIYSGKNPYGSQSQTRFDSGWDASKNLATKRFMNNDSPILVATKAFGMGIDKPNIRWTIHLGFPSSIEAFAQEAGRAGRDHKRSHCVLVSGQLPHEQVDQLLSINPVTERRRELYQKFNSERKSDDVMRQLHFLYNSFPGYKAVQYTNIGLSKALERSWVIGESAQALKMWDELIEKGATPSGQITIPRLPSGARRSSGSELFNSETSNAIRMLRDKVLYRLSLVGVVDDITVEYGADEVTVYFAHYSHDYVDRAFRESVNRIAPGQYERHERIIRQAPAELNERIGELLDYVVLLVYEIIEPSRLNALREIWRLTNEEPSDEKIRGVISAYLSVGPMATTLQSLASGTTVDLDEVFRSIDLAPPMDSFEWLGAAIRQLEGGSTHPVVRLVRALAESHIPNGNPETFVESFLLLIDNAEDYGIGQSELGKIFIWSRSHLRTINGGKRSDWVRYLWAAFLEKDAAMNTLKQLLEEVLWYERVDSLELEIAMNGLLRHIINKIDNLPLPEEIIHE